ncbi:MAG TPA: hypothetical protein VMR34_01040 [Candidatus Saccharimonadales bacterium]|nr:hypothetical protein [Candidatus Saccharimonadales bacterium]
MKLIKLNQAGIAHWLVPALVVAIIGVVGVRVLTATHAATPAIANNSSSTGPLLFTTINNNQNPVTTSVITVNQNGSGKSTITPQNQAYPWGFVWSPDHTQIAYTDLVYSTPNDVSTARGTINIMNDNGTDSQVIKTMPAGSGLSNLVWSPDGKSLLFADGSSTNKKDKSKVYTIGVNGKNLNSIANLEPNTGAQDMQWSPNSKEVLLTGEPKTNPQEELTYVYTASGKLVATLPTPNNSSFWGNDAWTPDNSSLIFHNNTNNEISEMNVATQAVTAIAPASCSSNDVSSVNVSPNGDLISYDCVTPVPDTTPTQFTNSIVVSTITGSNPVVVASGILSEGVNNALPTERGWAYNSTALDYYVSSTPTSSNGNLYTVNADGSDTKAALKNVSNTEIFTWNSSPSNIF